MKVHLTFSRPVVHSIPSNTMLLVRGNKIYPGVNELTSFINVTNVDLFSLRILYLSLTLSDLLICEPRSSIALTLTPHFTTVLNVLCSR